QPVGAGLLGTNLGRRLPGAVAASAQSVPLGQNPARPVATHRGRTEPRARCDMTRALSASPVALLAFVAALALAAFAIQQGRLADDAVMLGAGAIRAGGGQVPIDRIVASYPTLPFLATTLLEMMVPTGTPSPA